MTAGPMGRGSLAAILLAFTLACTGAGPNKPSPRPNPVDGAPSSERCNRKGGRMVKQIPFGGDKYPVHIIAPAGSGSVDAMVVLHGGGGTAEKMVRQAGLEALVRTEGFIALVPQGIDQPPENGRAMPNRWDAGFREGSRNDVEYLDAVVEWARDEMCIDKVLVFGFSNGSQMAQRWACESETPDAVVGVAGELFTEPSKCIRGYPLRMYVGTADSNFDPTQRSGTGEKNKSLEECIDLVGQINQCGGGSLKAVDTQTIKKTTCTTWKCDTPLVSCEVKGLGHAIPKDRAALGCHAPEDGWAWFESLPRG